MRWKKSNARCLLSVIFSRARQCCQNIAHTMPYVPYTIETYSYSTIVWYDSIVWYGTIPYPTVAQCWILYNTLPSSQQHGLHYIPERVLSYHTPVTIHCMYVIHTATLHNNIIYSYSYRSSAKLIVSVSFQGVQYDGYRCFSHYSYGPVSSELCGLFVQDSTKQKQYMLRYVKHSVTIQYISH